VRGGGDAFCGVRAIAPRKNARRGVVMSSMDELDAEGEPLDRSWRRRAAPWPPRRCPILPF